MKSNCYESSRRKFGRVSKSSVEMPQSSFGNVPGFAILTVVASLLLLRYLHVQGIEAVYMDLVTTPSAGLPLLGLTMLLMLAAAVIFTFPVWLLGSELVKSEVLNSSIVHGNSDAGGFCVAGFYGEKFQCFWRKLCSYFKKYNQIFAVIALGVSWGIQLLAMRHVDDWHTLIVIVHLTIVPVLTGLGVAFLLGMNMVWGLAFGLLNLICSAIVFLYGVMLNLAITEDVARWQDAPISMFSPWLTAMIYAFAIGFYVRFRDLPQSKRNVWWLPGALAENMYRWLPQTIPLLFICAESAALYGSEFVKFAGEVAGIETKQRMVLVVPPARGGNETLWLPSGWNTSETSFHFGSLDVLCEKPGGACYLIKDGIVSSVFVRTAKPSADSGKNDKGSESIENNCVQ